MLDRKFISASGVAAGLVCAVIPLAITGLLLFRYLTGTGGLGALLYFCLAFGAIFIPVQLTVNAGSKKYCARLAADKNAQPARNYKIINGVFYGMMAALMGMAVVLAWTYLTL